MGFGGWGDEEDLGGIERGETLVRIDYRENIFSIKNIIC